MENNLQIRRQFLARMSIFLIGLVAALVSIPFVGFFFIPLYRKINSTWQDVGDVSKFPVGQVTTVVYVNSSPLAWDGETSLSAAYVQRKSESEFIAYSVNCTHLGCPVRWLADAQLFMCPCHGGVFYPDGKVVAGPPSRPLQHYPVRVRNNCVEILPSPIPITTLTPRHFRHGKSI
jgi:menaquinol-cytochrome c reductase iron-sulfur subunit